MLKILFSQKLKSIFKTKQALRSVDVYKITLFDFLDILYGTSPEPINWLEIHEKWLELNQKGGSSEAFLLNKAIYFISNKIYLTTVLVNALIAKYNDSVAVTLRKLYPIVSFNLDSLELSIKQVKAQVKVLQIELENKKVQLKNLQKDLKVKTKDDYAKDLAILGKFQQCRLDGNSLTMVEYCNILSNFNEHIKHLENGAKRADR